MSSSAKLIIRFVIHICVASVLFAAVTLAAFGLWLFTDALKKYGAPYEIWIVSYAVSELVFWLDVLCFVIFVGAEVWKLIRAIINDAKVA